MDVSGGWTGVVCDDRPAVRRTVLNVLSHCGFAAGGDCDSFPAFRELVRTTRPAVAIVTLPLAGMNGLAAVRLLCADAPQCEVIVLSSFDQLEVAAVEAGARALVPEDDPQALRAVLRALAAQLSAGPSVPLPSQRPQLSVEPPARGGASLWFGDPTGSRMTKSAS